MENLPTQPLGPNKMPKKYNGYAIAGFILALISAIFFDSYPVITGVVSLVAIILSTIGLRQINMKNMKGKILAIIGIILGVFNVFGFILVVYSQLITKST